MGREPAAKQILVGREAELEQLHGWYANVLDDQRQVVFVTGEAGTGKTAFVQAFLDSISQSKGTRVGRGQCQPPAPAMSRLASHYRRGPLVGLVAIR